MGFRDIDAMYCCSGIAWDKTISSVIRADGKELKSSMVGGRWGDWGGTIARNHLAGLDLLSHPVCGAQRAFNKERKQH